MGADPEVPHTVAEWPEFAVPGMCEADDHGVRWELGCFDGYAGNNCSVCAEGYERAEDGVMCTDPIRASRVSDGPVAMGTDSESLEIAAIVAASFAGALTLLAMVQHVRKYRV